MSDFILRVLPIGIARAFALLAIICVSGHLYGQDDLNIHGVISDAMTSSKLGDVQVNVLKDGSNYDSYTTRANGKYEFYLDIGAHYELKFVKEGFVQRSIVIDSRNVPDDVVGAGIIMPTDMSMYEITPAMEGEDLSVFEEPIGKASYSESEQDLSWDFQYTNQVKSKIFALMRDVEKKQKELDKEASAEEKAKDELEEKFAQFVKDGDSAMKKEDFEDAVLNYQAAVDLKPDDMAVKAKLGDAETKLNALKAEKELNESYNAALDAGDGFMRTEEFKKAIEQYEAALELKPDEEYPTTQIAEANKILEERAAEMAMQEQFNEIMSRADKHVSEEEWSEAIASYKEALEVIPDNREAQNKLENAEEALQSQQEMAEKQSQYEDAVAKADQAFDSQDYQTAQGFYQAALEIFPEESHPQDRLDKCIELIEQAEQAAAVQEEFDALIAKGDDALAQSKYALAVESFQGAVDLIPSDSGAKTKLESAQQLLAEKEAAAEKQEQYNELISTADDLFSDESYEEAKTKYREAKELLPEENYPLDQIAKIDQILNEIAEQQATEEAYTNAMEAGRSAMDAETYSEAINQFELALAAKPEDKDATDSLEEAKALQTELQASQEMEEQYNALISSGDEKMANEKLQEAINDYRAALEVKPKESYPSDQIALIDEMIKEREAEAAEQERLAEIEAQFQSLMEEGNQKMTSEEYSAAIEKYKSALELKPEDETASAKIEEAESMLSDAEKEAEINRQYTDLIAQADENFSVESWDDAKSKYQEAQELKPEESYPADQIALIDERIAAAEQAQLEQQQAELESQVRQLVTEGDQLVADKSYVEGVDKYEEALVLMPDRKDIQEKIDRATEEYLAYQEANALEDAYTTEIAEGDKQFKDENWERAKASYSNALEIKPDENYPATQIDIIDEKLAALEAAAEAEREAEIQAEFNKFIEDGDKRFSKQKYDKALEEYENALALIPDSELALEKIADANKALGAISEAEEKRNEYERLIDAGDELFDSEDWEMAKLKFLDASELFPEEDYPKKKITEIDLLIEKSNLKDQEAAQAKIEEDYRNAIKIADESMAILEYQDAIGQYEAALEIKPDELYPKSQIERIELLIKEDEEARLRRERQKELEKEAALKRKNRQKNQVVNTNSEEQAEQFMREAREAQEKERYERIKKMKEKYKAQKSELEELSASNRSENYQDLQALKTSGDTQFELAAKAKEDEREKAKKSRQSLEETEQLRTEMEKSQREVTYEQIKSVEKSYESMQSEMAEIHSAKVRSAQEDNEKKLEQMEAWAKESANKKQNNKEKIQTDANEVYAANAEADKLREERSRQIKADEESYKNYQKELSEKNREDIKEKALDNKEFKERYEKSQASSNAEKVSAGQQTIEQNKKAFYSSLEDKKRMANEKRERNAEELKNLKSIEPKTYGEYFRTELAENYPQGVTEESSTLGNKVIITRIVVKGNKGDEYKKVLDKAGNYYFKNGQSISENTWQRETIDAFNKGRD